MAVSCYARCLLVTAIPALPVMRPPPANRPGLILLSAARFAPGY
ncbi:hypothetical protein [Chitinophaga tropicalis]|nr:hypothetical protein [Chitinophaga tropicalis]